MLAKKNPNTKSTYLFFASTTEKPLGLVFQDIHADTELPLYTSVKKYSWVKCEEPARVTA